MLSVAFFFFFKQKTAYEMRISDWSSDVCSSDLIAGPALAVGNRRAGDAFDHPWHGGVEGGAVLGDLRQGVLVARGRASESAPHAAALRARGIGGLEDQSVRGADGLDVAGEAMRLPRSEEHTSELQSLMRISYAVFCLKKKKKHK